jgi:Protein NO VEIN, C-terminal
MNAKQSGVQILISNADRSLQILKNIHASTRSLYWYAPKLTEAGDKVLFYVVDPVSAIVAIGEALSETRATDRKWYEAKVGNIQMLESPIKLNELRSMFPDWTWLRSVNMFTYVSLERAKVLLERAKLPILEPEAGDGPRGKNNLGGNGGGFGDPKINYLVERAAVAKVRRVMRARGFFVKSREKEYVGYDLDCRKGNVEIHVEVKGVSGTGLQFPITKNELERSRRDVNFMLMVVANARSRTAATVHEFGGAKLKELFLFTPISYMATKR